MKTHKHVLIITLLTAFLAAFSPLGSAAGMQTYGSELDDIGQHKYCANTVPANQSYGSKIGNKALRGITNIVLSPMEIPKNVIEVSNISNPFYGIIGGIFKGLVYTAGRMGAGMIDLVFFPLPTKPNVDPIFPWDDYFDRETTFCDVFDLDFAEETEQPIAPMPVAQPAAAPLVVNPKANVVDHTDQYREETDRNLNQMFKKEMLK